MIRIILITVLSLFVATGAVNSQERHGGGHGDRVGEHGVSGQRGGPRGDWHHGGGWGGGWGHRNDDIAGSIIGGFLGGVAGSIFAPDPPPPSVVVVEPPSGPAPWSPEWYDYCNGKYKSFDAKSGYFTGYDGVQHFCQ